MIMKRYILFLAVLFSFAPALAQKDSKIDALPFCGWKYSSKKRIREHFGEQVGFLAPQNGDTIVDIGAASGTYEGCLCASYELENVNFVLVDVDNRCLNEKRVENMRRYYSSVKGDSIRNAFQIVINKKDSLFLPLRRYKKVWLLNTLHEVGSQEKMARDINAILQSDGEVCVLEIIPEYAGQLHGGCNHPLLSSEEIDAIFLTNGFRKGNTKNLYQKEKATIALLRYLKN